MPYTPTEREQLVTSLVELDSAGAMVSYSAEANEFIYSPSIRSDEGAARTADSEEFARALTLALLATDAYAYSAERFYIEKYYTIGHPSTSGAEVDLIIYDEDGLSFAMWEMKEPGTYQRDMERAIRNQLFATAPMLGEPRLLVYSTITGTTSPAIECMVIDYTAFKTFEAWDAAGRPHTTQFPRDYQLPTYEPYTNGGTRDLNEGFRTEDFRAIAQAFHAEFFSEHPDTEVFSSVVKCLLAKILDERNTRRGDRYQFQLVQRNGKDESAQSVFGRVDALYSRAYTQYIDREGADALDPRVFPPERVKTVVKALQGVALTRGAAMHGDVIGTFFEEILRSGFKQDKGMYFTHSNLVWFMLEAVGLEDMTVASWKSASHPSERLPYVIDPSCGSGSFLLRAMQVMTNAIRSRREDLVSDDDAQDYFARVLPDHRPNAWAQDYIYGSDPKFVMAITAKVNMVLHGDGSAHIFKWDSLSPLGTSPDARLRSLAPRGRSIDTNAYRADMSESFDLVVSNPPFGITLAPETRRALPSTFTLPGSSSSESLFLERWFQLLKPGGRLAVVVPESLLNTAEADTSRMFLYRCFNLRAIVALPRNLFVETPTLTSLLFAQKKSGDEIRAWDRAWAQEARALDAIVASVGDFLSEARRDAATPIAIQAGFLERMKDFVDADTVLSSPRSKALIPMSLPSDVSSTNDAVKYYRDAMKSVPFSQLVRNRTFLRVTEQQDYTFPVYMIEEGGYKLSKRGEKPRPNELCRFVDEQTGVEVSNLHLAVGAVAVAVDTDSPSRVLDYMRRDVQWT